MSMLSVGCAYWSWRCSWGDGVRWRTADGAMTRLSVNEVSMRRLLELAMAAGLMESVCARLMEL